MKSDNGTESDSRFRVSATGLLAESGDQGSDGAGVTRSITIDKIADDGITLTAVLTRTDSDSPPREVKEQMFIPYGKELTVARIGGATLMARLEDKK